jgi:carbonic anhydrase
MVGRRRVLQQTDPITSSMTSETPFDVVANDLLDGSNYWMARIAPGCERRYSANSYVLGRSKVDQKRRLEYHSRGGVTMKRAVLVLLVATFTVSFAITALSQSAAHTGSNRGSAKAPSADQIWSSLSDGNKRFVDGKPTSRDVVSERRSLEKSQHPLVAVLSCSDSRVPPEVIFDQGLGDLFVVRTAGNSADPLGIGSLEYAVEHLGTVVIVVLGHQSCGAVTAACSGEKMATSNLEAVVQPVAQSCSLAKEQKHSGEGPVDFAIRDHVHRTAHDLLTHSIVLKHAHDEGKLSIIEAYYSLDSGTVTRLH